MHGCCCGTFQRVQEGGLLSGASIRLKLHRACTRTFMVLGKGPGPLTFELWPVTMHGFDALLWD